MDRGHRRWRCLRVHRADHRLRRAEHLAPPAFVQERFAIPFIASAMDGVVDVQFAVALGKLGGLAVLNLEGLQTRCERPEEPLAEIAQAQRESATELMQRLYAAPIREDLVARRVEEIKSAGVVAAVSATPSMADRLGPV